MSQFGGKSDPLTCKNMREKEGRIMSAKTKTGIQTYPSSLPQYPYLVAFQVVWCGTDLFIQLDLIDSNPLCGEALHPELLTLM